MELERAQAEGRTLTARVRSNVCSAIRGPRSHEEPLLQGSGRLLWPFGDDFAGIDGRARPVKATFAPSPRADRRDHNPLEPGPSAEVPVPASKRFTASSDSCL
jgi:hypothetical protein